MKIAIDINDVVRDYTNQFIKCYQKIVDPSFEITQEEITDFDFLTCFLFLTVMVTKTRICITDSSMKTLLMIYSDEQKRPKKDYHRK